MVVLPLSNVFPGLLFLFLSLCCLLVIFTCDTAFTHENTVNYRRTRTNQQDMTIAWHFARHSRL